MPSWSLIICCPKNVPVLPKHTFYYPHPSDSCKFGPDQDKKSKWLQIRHSPWKGRERNGARQSYRRHVTVYCTREGGDAENKYIRLRNKADYYFAKNSNSPWLFTKLKIFTFLSQDIANFSGASPDFMRGDLSL